MNLDEFLKFTIQQRKQLVLDTLKVLHSLLKSESLVDKKSGMYTAEYLKTNHIILTMKINGLPYLDEKGKSITMVLPTIDIGLGQAGYSDRKYVYSETYFLNLKLNDKGQIVSGDPNKFIIEGEK